MVGIIKKSRDAPTAQSLLAKGTAMSKEDNIGQARIHYITRATRRPKQVWNKVTREWEHFDR